MPAEFDENNRQTVASMKYGRVDSTYLTTLIMEHKANIERFGKGYPVSNELASVIRIVIKKTAGLPMWHEYTDDWKEEMFGRAELLALKYVHNFDPEKMRSKSKNNDPYYYIAMIVTRAFQQKLNELKKKSRYIQFTSLNENVLHSVNNLDEYAGVVAKAIAAEQAELAGSVGARSHSDDDGAETLETIGL